MSTIGDKRDDLLRGGFGLGAAVGKEKALPDEGRYQAYERATIYWSQRTGAHVVADAILERYREMGGPDGELGYPLTDPQRSCYSEHVRFENGSLFLDLRPSGIGVHLVPARHPMPDLDPALHGKWEVARFESGVVGIHAALFPPNHVLFVSYKKHAGCTQAPTPFGESALVDFGNFGARSTPLVAGEDPPAPELENLFCGGHAFLADGRLMFAGGEREDDIRRFDHAVRGIHIFSPGGPGGGTWRHVADCARGRWYPTCATLPDGRVIIVGGSIVERPGLRVINPMIEIYDPATNSVSVAGYLFEQEYRDWPTYPFVFTLPGNRVLIHYGKRTRFFDLTKKQLTSEVHDIAERPLRWGRTAGEGTAVILPLLATADPPYRTRIMLIGGGGPVPRFPATDTCEILDLGESPPSWRLAAPMHSLRVIPDAVLLPDGTVFVCNGARVARGHEAGLPVEQAEIYDPETNTWTLAGTQAIPRVYHATAVLLPDGRVVSAGTDCAWNLEPYQNNEMTLEIYSPPYYLAARPDIGSSIRSPLFHGEELVVPTRDAEQIDRVALVRCGSVTHAFNSDQRYVCLRILERREDSVRVAVPSDSAVAPPGPYMLFVLNRRRIPSLGRFVLLSDERILHELPHGGPIEFESREQAEKKIQKQLEALQNEVAMLTAMVRELASATREPEQSGDGGHSS